MTRANKDGGQRNVEADSGALRNSDFSAPHPSHLPTGREGATRLILSVGDAGRVAVHWHVAASDLRHLHDVFPLDADPVPVVQLIRLSESGGGELVERLPLSGTDLLSAGEVSFDLSGGRLAVQAELGLETPAGGWLLLVRSNRVTFAAEVVAKSPDVVTLEFDPLHVEAALAATGAELVRVFPEVTVTAARQGAVAGALIVPPAGGSASVGDHVRTASVDASVTSPTFPARDDAAVSAEQPRSSSYGVSEPRYGANGEGVEVHTELLVRGRAKPGSAIDLFGHCIQVGSGGRFSLHLPVSNSQLLQQALDQGMPLANRSDPSSRDL